MRKLPELKFKIGKRTSFFDSKSHFLCYNWIGWVQTRNLPLGNTSHYHWAKEICLLRGNILFNRATIYKHFGDIRIFQETYAIILQPMTFVDWRKIFGTMSIKIGPPVSILSWIHCPRSKTLTYIPKNISIVTKLFLIKSSCVCVSSQNFLERRFGRKVQKYLIMHLEDSFPIF